MEYIHPLFTLTFSDDRLSPRSTRLGTKGSFEDVPDVTQDAVQIVEIDPVGSKTLFFSNDFARFTAVSMALVRTAEHIQFANIGRNRSEHSTPLNHLPCLSFLIEHMNATAPYCSRSCSHQGLIPGMSQENQPLQNKNGRSFPQG